MFNCGMDYSMVNHNEVLGMKSVFINFASHCLKYMLLHEHCVFDSVLSCVIGHVGISMVTFSKFSPICGYVFGQPDTSSVVFSLCSEVNSSVALVFVFYDICCNMINITS